MQQNARSAAEKHRIQSFLLKLYNIFPAPWKNFFRRGWGFFVKTLLKGFFSGIIMVPHKKH